MTGSRRAFLRSFGAGVALVTAPSLLLAHQQESPRILDLQRGKERYSLDILTAEGYATAAWLLRDVQARYLAHPNVDTLRQLAWAQAFLAAHGRHTVFMVSSGARTRRTNALVEGAAHDSRHIPDGKGEFSAVDLIPDNLDLRLFAEIMKMPRFGGVGLYKSHIHIHRGPYRVWEEAGLKRPIGS